MLESLSYITNENFYDMRKQLLITLIVSSLVSTSIGTKVSANSSEDDIRFVSNSANNAPFSTLVETDGLIFLSGALGIDPKTGKLAEGGIEAEARQTLDNIKASLAKENVTMNRIVKCTVMLADITEWPALNKVYAKYFDGNYPARSAFAARALALNARVEIECIAKR